MQVKWLRRALLNVEQVYKFIAKDNPQAAERAISKLQAATSQLKSYPFGGRPGRVDGTRELVIANIPYIVVYRARNEMVEILRLLHTSKRYPTAT